MQQQLKKAGLSVFSLVMITVGSVDSVRNLPATALFGNSLIFFFLLAAVFFLLPCALVSAELASAWTEEGGVYIWARAAFGKPMGFLAVWFQWVENVIWYPTILSFVAGTVAYVVAPTLSQNKFFLMCTIQIVFWLATFINLYGMKTSAWFSGFCGVLGLIVPMLLIITLGIIWYALGRPLAIPLQHANWLPVLSHSGSWVALTGIVLSFCGMEIATVHARDVNDPQRAFPRALTISTLIILSTLMLGSLSIAIVLPVEKISLVAGLMEAYDAFFTSYHLQWLLPCVGLMLVIGAMGGVSNWIIAPIRGLEIAGEDGNLPAKFVALNRHDSPYYLLISQAVIVSVVTLIFLLLPSVNGCYWFLTALASQLYMIMYFIMFISGIVLRYRHPNQARAFRIPGPRHLGMWVVAGAGIIGAFTTFIIGFFPPDGINIGNVWHYELMLLIGLLAMSIPPVIITRSRRGT